MFIANSARTDAGYTLNDIKAWFSGNAIEYCHDYHGSINGVSWSMLAYDGYIPFTVLIDRDKMVRMVGRGASNSTWNTVMQEINGAI